LIFLPSLSLQPLETKGIQEFLLAISDFLKSVELVHQGGKTK
jgi:ribosome-associated protein YbcJ (S4-like RNA binding protein)